MHGELFLGVYLLGAQEEPRIPGLYKILISHVEKRPLCERKQDWLCTVCCVSIFMKWTTLDVSQTRIIIIIIIIKIVLMVQHTYNDERNKKKI